MRSRVWLVWMCAWCVIFPAVALAQADEEGTLYLYRDAQGAEVSSLTPLQSEELEFIGRVRPSTTSIWGTKETSSSKRRLAHRLAPYRELVEQLAPEYELDPVFVMAVIEAESGFDPQATSSVGAMGLMQLMPSNAKRFGLDDPYDPTQNITGGCMLLSRLMKRYEGDVAVVLAAYSAGDRHVKRAGGVPDFSKPYIARVVRAHARITALYKENPIP